MTTVNEKKQRYAWNERVASRSLAGEAAVLLDGRMLMLNGVGTFVWEAFEQTSTIQNVVDSVVEVFDVLVDVAENDVRGFVKELSARGVLVEEAQSVNQSEVGI